MATSLLGAELGTRSMTRLVRGACGSMAGGEGARGLARLDVKLEERDAVRACLCVRVTVTPSLCCL